MEREQNEKILSRIPVVFGTLLVWAPTAFTVITSAVGSIMERRFLFDYMMPAELFPAALAGSLLLLWAAMRSRRHMKSVAVSIVLAAFFLAGSITVASVTGLASGKTLELPFIMAVTLLALYDVALIGVGISGIMLWKTLFRNWKQIK